LCGRCLEVVLKVVGGFVEGGGVRAEGGGGCAEGSLEIVPKVMEVMLYMLEVVKGVRCVVLVLGVMVCTPFCMVLPCASVCSSVC